MLTAFYVVVTLLGVATYCWMMSDDPPTGWAGIAAIGLCVGSGVVAHASTWWLGALALVGTPTVIFLICLIVTSITVHNLIYDWNLWRLDRQHQRQRKRYEKSVPCK